MRDLIYLEPSEKQLKRKLTLSQKEWLIKICQTNGGGINMMLLPDKTLKGLLDRWFIQGKSGRSGLVVHTKEGWQEYLILEPNASE